MSDWFWKRAIEAAEKGIVPDAVLRAGIRRLCTERLREEEARDESSAEFAARALELFRLRRMASQMARSLRSKNLKK